MTVAELIEALQEMPRSATVIQYAESGFNGIEGIETQEVFTTISPGGDEHSSWYGKYQGVSALSARRASDKVQYLKAVVIK